MWTAILAALIVVAAWQSRRDHQHVIEHLNRTTAHIKGRIAMANQDLINAITAKLEKARAELVAQIADLHTQIEAAGAADRVDLTALTAAADALDDIVPDVPDAEPDPVV